MLDIILVVQGLYEQLEEFVLADLWGAGTLSNMSFLRMLRLMKMLKLLRMIRLLRMFRELRLILNSIMGCVKSMMWACVLILALSYMFAIVFLQAATQYLQHDTVDPIVAAALDRYWSSVGQSVLTLYVACMGGADWEVMADPLKETGLHFYLLFLFQIAVYSFVIMNTISSVFMEAVLANADKDHQQVIEHHMEKKEVYIDKLQVFYDEIDDNKDGELGYEEFMAHADSPHMHAFANSLEIDLTDAKQFFQVLSNSGRRAVNIETFVVGCIKLKGMARSMDLMDLVYQHRQAVVHQEMFEKKVFKRLDELRQSTSHHHHHSGDAKHEQGGAIAKALMPAVEDNLGENTPAVGLEMLHITVCDASEDPIAHAHPECEDAARQNSPTPLPSAFKL